MIIGLCFYTWIHHHDIGAGSAGAGRTGTVGIKYDADPGSCRGSRNLSGGCCTAYAIFKTTVIYAADLLSGGIYPDIFCIEDFLAIAFDSGGVTTGPMTVPFIMALGVGFSAVRSDKYAETDSFGLVSLCSIGPVLAVLLLGIIYHPQGGSYSENVIPDAETSVALWKLFESGIPHYMKEIGGSLLPIILFFAFFQVVSLKLKKRKR